MRVRELIEHLQTLDQDAEIFEAWYDYDLLGGFFSRPPETLRNCIKRPHNTGYGQRYSEKENVYLMDFKGFA